MIQMPPNFYELSNESLKNINVNSNSPSDLSSSLNSSSLYHQLYPTNLNTLISNQINHPTGGGVGNSNNTDNSIVGVANINNNNNNSNNNNNNTTLTTTSILISNSNLNNLLNINNIEENITGLNEVITPEDLIDIMQSNYPIEEMFNYETDELIKTPQDSNFQINSNLQSLNNNNNYNSNYVSLTTRPVSSITVPHLSSNQYDQQQNQQLGSTSSNLISSNCIKQEKFRYDEDTCSNESSSTFLPAIKTLVNTKNGKITVEKVYGPITVRPRRNPAPTLNTGRMSKYTSLTAEEEAKREVRRRRNRQAAEKCKIKRNEIEYKLEEDLKILLNQDKKLKDEYEILKAKKQKLEETIKQHIELSGCLSLSNKTDSINNTTNVNISYNEPNYQFQMFQNQTNNLTNEFPINNDFNNYYIQPQQQYNQMNLQQQQQTQQAQIPTYQQQNQTNIQHSNYIYNNSNQWR